MAMDFLTNLFGISNRACHTALADCDGEAIVMSAFIRFIAKWDRQKRTGNGKYLASFNFKEIVAGRTEIRHYARGRNPRDFWPQWITDQYK